jgi:hypothetical protein
LLTTLRNAFNHIGGECNVEFPAGVVIEEVQRLCALHEQIVHGHGYQVDALRANPRSIPPRWKWVKAWLHTDSIVDPRFDCDTELCTDAIRATHKQWVCVARCLEIKDATEPPDLGVGTSTSCCAHVGFDRLNECVPFIN